MMDGTVLGKAIATAILDPGASAEAKATCEDVWTKIANQIVLHIQQNAAVQPGIQVQTTFSPSPLPGTTITEGKVL